jgi:hypothetical protein
MNEDVQYFKGCAQWIAQLLLESSDPEVAKQPMSQWCCLQKYLQVEEALEETYLMKTRSEVGGITRMSCAGKAQVSKRDSASKLPPPPSRWEEGNHSLMTSDKSQANQLSQGQLHRDDWEHWVSWQDVEDDGYMLHLGAKVVGHLKMLIIEKPSLTS